MPKQISKQFPELVSVLAEATILSRKLDKILNAAKLAPKLGISKQGYEFHIDKAEKGVK